MARKALLFAYGTLMPGHSPPRSMSAHWPDRIRGRLFDLGTYPGVISIGTADSFVDGFTVEFDLDELDALDAYEDIESGEFARRLITTEGGHVAWVYEYMHEPPSGAVAQKSWKGALLAGLVALCAFVPGCRSLGDGSEAKLVGGTVATEADLPGVFIWTSEGSNLRESYCTGTKIGPGLILTAGHCVLRQVPRTGQVYLGPWQRQAALAPGRPLTLSFARSLAPRNAEIETLRIKEVLLPPAVEACLDQPEADPAHCQYRAPLPDVAVIRVEETDGVFVTAPARKIARNVVEPGRELTLCGYGSEGTAAASAPRLKQGAARAATLDELAAALIGSDAERDGSPDLAYYFASTTTRRPGRDHLNLGSGDSGGPVFDAATGKIVGVNSDGFCPLTDLFCEITNNSLFARLDDAGAGAAGAWVESILSN